MPSNKSQLPFFNEITKAESQSLLNLFAGIIIFPISIRAFLKISLSSAVPLCSTSLISSINSLKDSADHSSYLSFGNLSFILSFICSKISNVSKILFNSSDSSFVIFVFKVDCPVNKEVLLSEFNWYTFKFFPTNKANVLITWDFPEAVSPCIIHALLVKAQRIKNNIQLFWFEVKEIKTFFKFVISSFVNGALK